MEDTKPTLRLNNSNNANQPPHERTALEQRHGLFQAFR